MPVTASNLGIGGTVVGSSNGSVEQRDGYLYVNITGGVVSIRMTDNDVLSNIWFNIQGGGNGIQILTYGVDGYSRNSPINGDFEISNIAIEGAMPSGDATPRILGIGTQNGHGLIENLYVPDGWASYPVASNGAISNHGGWAISSPGHGGHIDVRRCYTAQFVDNNWYCSVGSGTYAFEDCYAVDSQIASYRLSGGDSLVNCVGHYDQNGGRALYVYGNRPGRLTVDGCDLISNHSHNSAIHFISDGAQVDLSNTEYTNTNNAGKINDQGGNGNNPQLRVPSGCPQSYEAAATGEGGGGTPSPPAETNPACVRSFIN